METAGRGGKGKVDAEVLLDGMLAHDRLLDIVENFILFDESKPGATRKVVARNHQVLGVNNAMASVVHQEALKREFPPERRLAYRVIDLPLERRALSKRGAEPSVRQPGLAEAPQSPSYLKVQLRSLSGRTLISAGLAYSGILKAAANPIPWRSSPRRCAGRCRGISPSFDDGPARP